MRWRFDVESFLADIAPTSLSQCVRRHLDDQKQDDDEKRAPTGLRDDGNGPLLFHLELSLLYIVRPLFTRFFRMNANGLERYRSRITDHYSFHGGVGRVWGVGRGLGVALGVAVVVGVGLGVAVGADCAQYLPPSLK